MRGTICIAAVLSLAVLNELAHGDLKSTGIERYDVAVANAVTFLQSTNGVRVDEMSLVAYALLKAGIDQSSEKVATGIAGARQRAQVAQYDQYRGSYVAAVDAMLLADANGEKHRRELQQIANLIISYQRDDGSWHDPRLGPDGPTDVSLTQYCILALWAAQRSGCRVAPTAFDKTAQYLIDHPNPDGGWSYRIGETGSKPSMTIAAIGTIGVSRLLLTSNHRPNEESVKFGTLKRIGETNNVIGYPNYQPKTDLADMDASIEQGLEWNRVRNNPIPRTYILYHYYTLERTATLAGLQEGWYSSYGDSLLSLQANDGHFNGYKSAYGSAVGTSFAILYFMRSTQQILDYGKGVQVGARDLVEFLHPKSKSKKAIGPLDDLLAAMEGKDFSELDVSTDEIVEKIQFSSREELIGQGDKLKALLKSPDAGNRQIAYWALSRTGDFDLVPLMLDGLNDPVLSVNVEALTGLRYISRKPSGFNLSLQPLSHLPDDANEEKRRNAAIVWRDKASRLWRQWYSNVRPYAQRDGLDEIGLPFD